MSDKWSCCGGDDKASAGCLDPQVGRLTLSPIGSFVSLRDLLRLLLLAYLLETVVYWPVPFTPATPELSLTNFPAVIKLFASKY